MKTLLGILVVSAILLYGCAGSGAQGTGQQQNTAVAGAANPAPAAGGGANPSPAPAPPAAKEFTIEASNWQFSPSTIAVNRGDRVKITLVNKDVSHGIAIPDFGFDLKAEAGATATGEFTANKTGAFPFRCNVFCGDGHREMTGTLVVN